MSFEKCGKGVVKMVVKNQEELIRLVREGWVPGSFCTENLDIAALISKTRVQRRAPPRYFYNFTK